VTQPLLSSAIYSAIKVKIQDILPWGVVLILEDRDDVLFWSRSRCKPSYTACVTTVRHAGTLSLGPTATLYSRLP
jgi:hypothetical protein